jgi:hypothetical protein
MWSLLGDMTFGGLPHALATDSVNVDDGFVGRSPTDIGWPITARAAMDRPRRRRTAVGKRADAKPAVICSDRHHSLGGTADKGGWPGLTPAGGWAALSWSGLLMRSLPRGRDAPSLRVPMPPGFGVLSWPVPMRLPRLLTVRRRASLRVELALSTRHKNIRGSARPGETLWVFLCRHCRQPIRLGGEQLEGLPAILSLDCSSCHSRDWYGKAEARRALARARKLPPVV